MESKEKEIRAEQSVKNSLIVREAFIEARLRKCERILKEMENVSVPKIPFQEFMKRIENKKGERKWKLSLEIPNTKTDMNRS